MSKKDWQRFIYTIPTLLLLLVVCFGAVTSPIHTFIVSTVETETEKCDPKAEKTLLAKQDQSKLTNRNHLYSTFLNKAGAKTNSVVLLPAYERYRDVKDRKYHKIPILRAPPIA